MAGAACRGCARRGKAWHGEGIRLSSPTPSGPDANRLSHCALRSDDTDARKTTEARKVSRDGSLVAALVEQAFAPPTG
jgi:hypothetical protein